MTFCAKCQDRPQVYTQLGKCDICLSDNVLKFNRMYPYLKPKGGELKMRLLTPIVLIALGLFLGACTIQTAKSPITTVDADGNAYRKTTTVIEVTTDTACKGSCLK